MIHRGTRSGLFCETRSGLFCEGAWSVVACGLRRGDVVVAESGFARVERTTIFPPVTAALGIVLEGVAQTSLFLLAPSGFEGLGALPLLFELTSTLEGPLALSLLAEHGLAPSRLHLGPPPPLELYPRIDRASGAPTPGVEQPGAGERGAERIRSS